MIRWIVIGLLLGSVAACGQIAEQGGAGSAAVQETEAAPPVSAAPAEAPQIELETPPAAAPDTDAAQPAAPSDIDELKPAEEDPVPE